MAHNSKMMHFSFIVFKQRSDSSFASDIFALWSGSIAFTLSVGPIWAGGSKEEWGLTLALKKLNLGLGC